MTAGEIRAVVVIGICLLVVVLCLIAMAFIGADE